MDEQLANLLVLQTGGPQPALNAVLAGIVLSVGRYSEEVSNVYGALHGLRGLLAEQFVDLLEEKRPTVEQIQAFSIPALGTSVFSNIAQIESELQKNEEAIFRILEGHQIRFMIVIGGLDAAVVALYLHNAARRRGYTLAVNSVPVSAGNELPFTEHSFGYGSYVRQGMLLLRLLERDLALRPRGEVPCCVVEVGGWNSGWESLGPACIARYQVAVPILALIPEMPLDIDEVVGRIVKLTKQEGTAIVLVPDGMRSARGELWARPGFGWDYFNQSVGPSAGAVLAEKIQQTTRRFVARLRLPALIRWWVGPYSSVDLNEAFRAGETTLQACLNEQSGLMAKVRRESSRHYRSEILFHPLNEVVASPANCVPKEWFDELDWKPRDAFWRFVEPIIQDDAPMPYAQGIPKYIGLELHPIARKIQLERSAAS